MKKFIERADDTEVIEDVVEDVDEHVLQVQVLPSTEELLHSQLVDKVQINNLSSDQANELLSVLLAFKHVFSSKAGKTTLVSHRIELLPGATPVRRSPYRVHPEKLKVINQEISALLSEGIIEESDSPWAAPIILVPKPDGSERLCTIAN